jgi:hypothetical protein
MNQPTPELPQQSDAAATESIAAAPKASASAEKKAAKTAATSTSKPAKKLAAKASAKLASKTSAAKVVAAPIPPEATEVATATLVKTAKPKKAKLVRDSFTMPESEYNLIAEVKKRCLARGESVKKSEVLRAAIIAFAAQPDASIGNALQALEIIKTGRPPKH